MNPQTTKSQSLERGLDILELIQQSDRPLGTREIARLLKLSPAVVQRLINTMFDRHYLRQDPETRRYRVGYQAVVFGGSVLRSDALLTEGRKELEEVTRKLRADSYMATLQGRRAFYLLRITGDAPVSVRCEPGDTIPLHSTAIGKCILASCSNDRILDLLGPEPYPAITHHTITKADKLLEEIERTRKQGYAVVENENIDGIVSVGALLALRDPSSRVAISVSFSPFFSKHIDIDGAAAAITSAARLIGRSARL